MNRDWLMRGAGYILATVGVLFGVVVIAVAAVGFLPLLAFGLFWNACPMTWESEFDAEAKRLLKGTKR